MTPVTTFGRIVSVSGAALSWHGERAIEVALKGHKVLCELERTGDSRAFVVETPRTPLRED